MQEQNSNFAWDIDARLRILVSVVLERRNDWKHLEEKTGIPAEKWRHWKRATTRPSAAMIEAVCTAWPIYAFWLTTGLTDVHFGHKAPIPALGFPQAANGDSSIAKSSEAYWKESQTGLNEVWAAFKMELADSYENNNDLALELMDDISFLVTSSQQRQRLGAESQQAMAKRLKNSLRARLANVIQYIRDSETWADAEIDYQRELNRLTSEKGDSSPH